MSSDPAVLARVRKKNAARLAAVKRDVNDFRVSRSDGPLDDRVDLFARASLRDVLRDSLVDYRRADAAGWMFLARRVLSEDGDRFNAKRFLLVALLQSLIANLLDPNLREESIDESPNFRPMNPARMVEDLVAELRREKIDVPAKD
jgi:hypothetical protein